MALALALLLTASGWSIPVAQATNLCVNQGGTGGCFGLIADAIAAAGTGDTIRIAGATSSYLERLTITKSLSLIGDVPATTIIDGALAGQVIWISPNLTVTLANLTIRNGQASAGFETSGYGGGIHSEATSLTLNNVIVSGNRTSNSFSFGNAGGGIYTQDGILTLNHSTVSGNTTGSANPATNGRGGEGGGIYMARGFLILNDSTVTGNSTGAGNPGQTGGYGGLGGGVYNNSGTVSLNRSTISGNTTGDGGSGVTAGGGGNGGGLYSFLGSLTVDDSTLSGNMTGAGGAGGSSNGPSGSGAGLYVFQEPVTITTSTISGNATGRGLSSSVGGDGGGIYAIASPVNLTNVTLAYNAIDTGKSGGAIANTGGVVNVKNSLLAKNHDAFGPDNVHDCSGAVNSLGYNVMTEPDCTPPIVPTNGDQFYVSGLIVLPLADNGGPTQTNALPPGSLAIDAAGNSACSPTDQRGFARPVFGGTALRCDVGAFELYRFGVNLPAIVR